jgi:diaminohydroxyphosphoribosylaminopyrimidine deaminase/5-amino-6-(5-phosphoribosylamino)uracil reductase
VLALQEAGVRARGATVYVTLEPCCHRGRTPPCTGALLDAEVARVVAGCRDPNPRVDGGGAAALREAGTEVAMGCLETQARELISGFSCRIARGRPEVWLKAALTLDGQLAPASGRARWITGPSARMHSRTHRDQTDAMVVGAGTVLADDPRLTVRDPDPEDGHQPFRVILDRRGRIPPEAKALGEGSLVVTGPGSPGEWRARVADRGSELLVVEAAEGPAAMVETLRGLGERGLTRVLVEGGSHVHGSLLAAGLADRAMFYYGAMLVGEAGYPVAGGLRIVDLPAAVRLRDVGLERLGENWLVSGLFQYPPREDG